MLITRKKDILILGRGPTQGLDGTILIAEKMYSINFTATIARFCLKLHYNGPNNYLIVNVTEIIKYRARDFEILTNPLSSGNISEDCSKDDMRKNWIDWICLRF